MDDLVQWLGEQLDEDERIARRAAELCGCHPDAPSWSFGDEETDGRILVVGDPHPDLKRRIGRRWNGSYEGLFMAEHIARHDPARVLREIDAKRQVLALYVEHERMDRETFEAEGDHARSLVSLRAAYLDAVRHHAAVYADRPGFREEWRP